MTHIKILVILISGFLFSVALAEENVDLNQLTIECVQAANRHQAIQKDFYYKVLHTVQYKGWIGEPTHFELTHPVTMTIRYAGASKKGWYWFNQNPKKKYDIIAKSDMAGNFELVGHSDVGIIGYTFHGLMKDGIIKGVWEKGSGKQAYAFYVKATRN